MATLTVDQQSHISIPEQTPKTYRVDLDLQSERVHQLVAERTGAARIIPDLVPKGMVKEASVYKRFADADGKDAFRGQMLETLRNSWVDRYGPVEAAKMVASFQSLAENLDENGAVIFGSILETASFEQLIARYNHILAESGSKSWIHSYVNLANHPDFLADKAFNEAFLHPVLVALVSYRVGGPIRAVDARGKDAEPISVLAQDNMLHIDNTPFNDEYKVILTWEKDKPSGPKGQNFVFLPGTHKGSRNCFVDESRGAWSSENASIFTTAESIDRVFQFQKEVRGSETPMVVEVTHAEKPLTTVFAAGSLVHHRYRTEEGFSRSCMILAFHRAKDNPGQLVAPEHLEGIVDRSPLNQFILGANGGDSNEEFLAALTSESDQIRSLLGHLEEDEAVQEVIRPEARELSADRIGQWMHTSTEAPTVEALKIKEHFVPLHAELSESEFVALVEKMMIFDKHGPLDLILFSDSHEEIRKWARNQIREINIGEMRQRVEGDWAGHLEQPAEENILSTVELDSLAQELAAIAQRHREAETPIHLREREKISRDDAYRSVHQLMLDLGESITRCEDRQAFLSTSLFLFLAADTLMRFQDPRDREIEMIGKRLLNHYVSTGILIEKQIETE
ncbi:MAG: hypothetical protein KFB95_07745 [Simkaniaceae bacterium]|nr:MAG: hypothetical protein KFB95_07745 [Simkaniaceae bacterium]